MVFMLVPTCAARSEGDTHGAEMLELLVHPECYTVHHDRLSEFDLFSPLS